MSCLPVGAHGRGLVLRTAEPPAVTVGQPGQAGQVTGGGQEAGPAAGHPKSLHLGPWPLLAPNDRGPGCVGPRAGFLSPFVSAVALVTVPVCFHPCLYFTTAFSASAPVCVLCFSLAAFFLPLPPLPRASSISRSFQFFLLCSPGSPVQVSFQSSAPSPPSLHPALAFSLLLSPPFTKSYVSQKKKGKNPKTQKKTKTKTNLKCVAKCRVLPVASVCVPVARSLPACPLLSAVCPTPACPLPAPPADDTEFSAWVFGDGY